MAPRAWSAGALLVVAVVAALTAEAGARWLAGPLEDRARSALVLALALRSVLWGGLGAWLRVPAPVPPQREHGAGFMALGVGLGTGLFSALVLRLLTVAAELEPPPVPALTALGAPWVVLLALGATLLAPLGEELFFRGALFDALARVHGARIALLGSTAAFALFHPHPAHLPAALVAGLALGWLRQRTGRLGPCVLAHALHNALWLGLR